MTHKSKSKSSGSKTKHNHNQSSYSNDAKTVPSKSKSNGAKEHYAGNRVTNNSNENAWGRSRHSSVSDMWSDPDEHFPALGASAASGPKVNVWEERKSKQEAIKALEPQNEYDEEAMLQHALALSLLEATEEERLKKIEDDYQMQLEALQYAESLENFVKSDECVKKSSKFQDDFSVKDHLIENNSESSVSKNIKNEKTSELQDANERDQLQNFSRNSVPSYSRKELTYNSGGARPKINKTIEAFGGWGLKDNKKNNSEKVSEFIDDIVSDKSNYNKTTSYDQKNRYKNSKEICNSVKENSFHTDIKDTKKSITVEKETDKEEILYDEKGIFLDSDDDGKWDDSKKDTDKLPSVSPNAALDTWLNSEDVDDWNNEILNNKHGTTINDKKSDDFILPSFTDKSVIEIGKNEVTSASTEFSISSLTNDCEGKVLKNSEILLQRPSESVKNVWSNTTNYKDKEIPENKNEYKYDTGDLNANNFTPFHEPTEVPTLTSCKIWSDKSSSDSSYFSSFSDTLANKVDSLKLSSDTDNEVFNVSSNSDTDVPPIPPPQPAAAISVMNECNVSATVIPDAECEIESPPVPQPQSVPEMKVPQFPAFVSPILNPMFPALNPMLGCGMDPLLMRQMLILSNPFLANQLLAMEQYYRSMGVPVDLFSMATPVPNMPAMLNPSLLQNSFATNVNGDIQQLQSEIQQLQTQIDANMASVNKNTIENIEQKSCEKSHESSELDKVLDFNKSSTPIENCNEDPWFKSYLSNDDASIIPPPKPPSNEIISNKLMPVSQKPESNQNIFSYDKLAHSQTSDNPVVHSSNIYKDRPHTHLDTSITKKEVSGWGDLEDDFADAQNLKSHTWDDGFEDAVAPPKPLRNASFQDDKKKTVFRQPAKQPQISRYQRNHMYS